jgi:hypothetical protein
MSSLPNLFLVGAAKAGTTSIHALLDAHPSVFMSRIKETNFFSQGDLRPELYSDLYKSSINFNTQAFRARPTSSLHIADIRSLKEYELLFSDVEFEIVVGECSNSYLFCPSAAKRIATHNPNAKILIILRNPVERAWSHYLMNIKLGYHVLPNFLDEIRRDTAAVPAGWGITSNYFGLGLYAAQVTRFYNHFNANQIKVILFEELVDPTKRVVDDLWNFLDIAPVELSAEQFRKNVAGVPRFPRLNRIIRNSTIVRRAHQIAPPKIKRLGELLVLSRRSMPKLSKEDQFSLLEMYKRDIKTLESIIQRRLNHWLN